MEAVNQGNFYSSDEIAELLEELGDSRAVDTLVQILLKGYNQVAAARAAGEGASGGG